MARPYVADEQWREAVEGDIYSLGNVRVYLGMVKDRVECAQRLQGGELLDMAQADLDRIDHLVHHVQTRLTKRLSKEITHD